MRLSPVKLQHKTVMENGIAKRVDNMTLSAHSVMHTLAGAQYHHSGTELECTPSGPQESDPVSGTSFPRQTHAVGHQQQRQPPVC